MNIYVGNLSYNATDDELHDLFAEFGEVTSARVIMDKVTGRSRGFGFVEMANQAEGEAAVSQLDNKEVGGRALKVNEARPREDRGGGGGGRDYGGGGGRGYGGGGGGRY